jgi:hypothetical protein
MWGDGSGTGTGGTIKLPQIKLQMWKGVWCPAVYKFSSNWKELATLRESVRRAGELSEEDLRGTTVFYFTDNSTTYWIACRGSSGSPELHKLIESIHLLELDMGIHLELVHVPGLLMIEQGTDALSRGVWMTYLQDLGDPAAMNAAIFEPLVPDVALAASYIRTFCAAPTFIMCHYLDPWDSCLLFHTLSVWFPPPEGARQLLCFLLETWVECPLTTSSRRRFLVGPF